MGIADTASLILVVAFSLLAGALATAFSMKLARLLNVMAAPTARGSHTVPTPRLGGFGYFIPVTVVLAVIRLRPELLYYPAWGIQPAFKTLFVLALICGSLAFVVGLMDDFLRLPPWFKLLGQIVCAALFLYLGSRIQYVVTAGDVLNDDGHVAKVGSSTLIKGVGFVHVAFTKGVVLDGYWAAMVAKLGTVAAHVPPLAAVVTFLWILVLMNACNFMDGIDGLAGTFVIAVAIGLFAAYLPEARQIFALRAHICILMVLGALLVGLSLGFLFYNWPPAKTFLGDCGSQYLGFLLAAILAQITRVSSEPVVDGLNAELEILIRRRAYVDVLACVILVFPFLYDVAYTLLRRLVHGKAVWRAHHEHLYQRLIDSGWSHRRVVLFSLPFYLAYAAFFYAYCWAPTNRARVIVAAAALAPMILYTLVVIVSEKRRPAPQSESASTEESAASAETTGAADK